MNANELISNAYDIAQDEKGQYWLSAPSKGLVLFNPLDSINSFNVIKGTDRGTKGILIQNHLIWTITGEGIMSYDIRAKRVRYFNQEEIFRHFNISGYLHKIDSSEFIIGGNGAIFHVYLNKFETNFNAPQLYIKQFLANNKERSLRDLHEPIILKANENYIRIKFSSIVSPIGISTEFKYKLEGIDNEWRDGAPNKEIDYINLGPGNYELSIVERISGSEIDSPIKKLSFIIQKPYYLQWWFVILLLCIVLVAINLLYRMRLKQYMRIQEMRNKIASDLHDEIGSSLSSISLNAQLAEKLAGNNQSKLNVLLAQIRGTAVQSLGNMGDIVWSIHPKNDSSENLILKMQRFANEIVQAEGFTLHFIAPEKHRRISFGMLARKNIWLIYKEALINAVKHSAGTEIRICIEQKGEKFRISVSDNGVGFNSDTSYTGHGIVTMKMRAKELMANLYFIKGMDSGNIVVFDADLTKISD